MQWTLMDSRPAEVTQQEGKGCARFYLGCKDGSSWWFQVKGARRPQEGRRRVGEHRASRSPPERLPQAEKPLAPACWFNQQRSRGEDRRLAGERI